MQNLFGLAILGRVVEVNLPEFDGRCVVCLSVLCLDTGFFLFQHHNLLDSCQRTQCSHHGGVCAKC